MLKPRDARFFVHWLISNGRCSAARLAIRLALRHRDLRPAMQVLPDPLVALIDVGAKLDRTDYQFHYAIVQASEHQRLIREMILQLKTGRLEIGYFRTKFGVDIRAEFAEAFRSLSSKGVAAIV